MKLLSLLAFGLLVLVASAAVPAQDASYYGAPYTLTGTRYADGQYDSLGDAEAAWWAGYGHYWIAAGYGYLGPLESKCSYVVNPRTPRSDDLRVEDFILTGYCGGGNSLVATRYAFNPGKNGGKPCDCAGDPINLGTGNEYREDEDLSLGRLTFRRHYNSHNSVVTANIGSHWRHTFDRNIEYLVTSVSETAIMYRPDGLQVAFTLKDGQWVTDTDVADRLSSQVDSTGNVIGWQYFNAATREVEAYDATGRLLSISDTSGQELDLAYSDASTPTTAAPSAGLLLTVTDPRGRSLSFTYNAQGNVASVIAPDGGTVGYAYSSDGDLATVTYPDAKTRQYLYNESSLTAGANLPHALTGDIDESGNRLTSIGYNAQRQATMSTLPDGAELTRVEYNADGTTSVTYPGGAKSTLTFSSPTGAVHATAVSNPCGVKCGQPNAAATLDNNGYVASTTDFNGNLKGLAHDANGLLTQEIDAKGSSDERTIDTIWDGVLRLPIIRTVKDRAGKLVSKDAWAYSTAGLTTATCAVDVAVASSYVCSPAGVAPAGVRRTVTTYCDAANIPTCPIVGLVLTVDGPRSDVTDRVSYAYYLTTDESGCTTLGGACHHLGDLQSTTDGAGLVTTYVSYDKAGRVTRIKDPNGILTDYTYTPRGWLATTIIRANASGVTSASDAVTTVTYDPTGTVHSVQDPDGVTTTYTYDAAHRLTDVTDALGSRIHYTLDVAGNRTAEQVLSPTGVVVRSLGRTYNALGQLTAITDGLNRTVFNAGFADSYDGNGNLIHTQDALSVQQKQVYDGLNRLVSTLRDYQGTNAATANAQSVTSFDALDRVTGFSDPDGLNTTYDFDGLGNATGLHSPDTGTTTRGFDVNGNAVSSVDAANIATASTYDALGRLTATTYPDTTQNVAYKYDEADAVTGCGGSVGKGRLTRIVEANSGLAYCYDQRGNVIRKQQALGAVTTATSYTWTLANRLKSVTTANGTLIAYTRNANGQISAVTATPSGSGATTVASQVTYQPFGPVASYVLGDGQTVARTYDATGQLTDIASAVFSLHVKRDAMGNIVALGDVAGFASPSETYSYDPLYRLTGVNAADGTAVEAYTYNKTGDRLSKVAPGLGAGSYSYQSGTHRLVKVGVDSRHVDSRGNTDTTALSGEQNGFEYDQRNRLKTFRQGDVTVGTYENNVFGQRVQKTLGNMVMRFDYDEASRLLGESDSEMKRDYVWLDDLPVGVVDDIGTLPSVKFVYADGVDAPRTITDAGGAILWVWDYPNNPFGEQSPRSASHFVYNLRFSGQWTAQLFIDTQEPVFA